MSKNRYVDTKFWDDTFIAQCDPIEKLLFLYFLTNPLTHVCGIYEIVLKRIAFDTGIDKEMVLKILERFEKHGKMKYSEGWIAIKNFAKHQKVNPNIEKGIKDGFSRAPNKLLAWVEESLDKPSKGFAMSLLNSNSNLDSNSSLDSSLNSSSSLDCEKKETDKKILPIIIDLCDKINYMPRDAAVFKREMKAAKELLALTEDMVKHYGGDDVIGTITWMIGQAQKMKAAGHWYLKSKPIKPSTLRYCFDELTTMIVDEKKRREESERFMAENAKLKVREVAE